MITIELDLHKEGNNLLLNSQDIYKYVGEITEDDIELAYYIDKYCQYLNYYVIHSREVMFGDTEYARLEGWLDGYNCAKKYLVQKRSGGFEIKTELYHIILPTPYKI